MIYNYIKNLKNDVEEYIDENKEYLEGKSFEQIYDILFIEDSITGNGSGSYTFSRQEAGENLAGNFDLLYDALEYFGNNIEALKKGEEYCDVTIRCYLLHSVLMEVLENIENFNWEE